jgi:hypothetical protein
LKLTALLSLLISLPIPVTASAGCELSCEYYLDNLQNAYDLDPDVENTKTPITKRDVFYMCGNGAVLDCYCCQGDGLTEKAYDFFIWWATVCATAHDHGYLAGAKCWNSGFKKGDCVTKIKCG